jgi:tripartite ATP-independent transporter DctM subunit
VEPSVVTVVLLFLASLFILNVPIAFAMVLASLLYYATSGIVPPVVLPQRMVALVESFTLLAVPFFILTGSLMNASGITEKLVRLASALVGHITGGLGQVNVVVSTLFGGLSGSANADAASQAKVVVPAMIKRGYSPAYSAAITASSAIITALIPPSITLIIYAWLAEVSVGRLFLGGIGPGLLVAVSLMSVNYVISRQRGYELAGTRQFDWRELWEAFKGSLWALTIPVMVVGGIRFGVFTATEAGAAAAVYAFFVGRFIFRTLALKDLPAILADAARASAVVMLIIAAAAPFGWLLTYERLPQAAAGLLLSVSQDPLVVLLLINLGLLLLGCFMEGTALLIILVPLLAPAVQTLGIDPIHFGVVIGFNILVGALTPPVGVLLYMTCSVVKGVTISAISREIWPFALTAIACLLLLTFVPDIVLFLPNLLMGR